MDLIVTHFKSQLDKWPELTKQALKKAEKTVKSQVSRQSNTKKAVKSLVLDLVIQQITDQPFKNNKRVEKKFRQMINIIGTMNAQKIRDCFEWSRLNEQIEQVFTSNVSEEVGELFKIRKLPEKANDYLSQTSIKCPMCNKYQPTTWQCLFCDKISCTNCMNTRFHCERDHRGSGIILHLHDAVYELIHENHNVEQDSLYRNQFSQGWKRNVKPQGWQAHTNEVYQFFDKILHSLNPQKRRDLQNENSDDERLEADNYGQDNYEQNNYEQDNYDEQEYDEQEGDQC